MQELIPILQHCDPETIILFFYLFYRLEKINVKIKNIEKEICGDNDKDGKRPQIMHYTDAQSPETI